MKIFRMRYSYTHEKIHVVRRDQFDEKELVFIKGIHCQASKNT